MRILITNDDGARAPGIKLLEEVALTLSDDVWVVAPEFDQSGVSHAISLHEPLRVHEEDPRHYFVRGTPADCVVLGIEHLLDRRPDLVLSGINRGMNAADSIAYSGTVGAAMTALACGVPAIALSQLVTSETVPWEVSRAYAGPIIERLLKAKWPRPVAPNVNFPACRPDEVAGVVVCPPGHGFIEGVDVDERVDVRGLSYHWLSFRRARRPVDDPDCDLAQLRENRITVTPLRPDRHAEGDWREFKTEYADLLAVAPTPSL
jgi:5'-nucleotidase